jgi:transketolase
MPILNSKTGKVRQDYTINQLKEQARLMRGYDMICIHTAGSGHPGGTLSIIDVVASLYLKVARHDPKNPNWDDRDRIIFSAGHKAPALYLGLAMSGYFPVEKVATLRKFGSPFQGHPHWRFLKGVEISSGSLGQGISVGVGIALRAKLDKKNYQTYVICGDGELDEGQNWEAAMEASHYQLNNLTVIVDRNHLQIDGNTKDVMDLEPLAKKFASFGFEVFKVNGHDIKSLLGVFSKIKKIKNKPQVIIADTIKGKGVAFMENNPKWHGVAPGKEELLKALKELAVDKKINLNKFLTKSQNFQKHAEKRLSDLTPKLTINKDYSWNKQNNMMVDFVSTREGFGKTLKEFGGDKRLVCLGLDISSSIQIALFYDGHPERKSRFLSMGIAEASATCVAAGLAKEGKLPVLSTYGVFASSRNLDQIRTTVCYGNFNVFIAGGHAGISVGADGATHQALEEIANMSILPNMHLVVPVDALELKKATEYLLFQLKGPKYMRFSREATPLVTKPMDPFVFGKANIIRFRKEASKFYDAFDTVVSNKYKNENEEISIISCGLGVTEAMRSAWLLKKEYNIETRIINMHTVKPLDEEAIIKAVLETKTLITVEEHEVGGFGNQIAGAILKHGLNKPFKMAMIGVQDRFGESGGAWELVKAFGLSAEHITKKATDLLKS